MRQYDCRGAVVVNTMPMLRAGELDKIIDKAEIAFALCDSRLLDDLLYNAPDIGAQTIPITPTYVRERLGALIADEDLTRYIL